MNLREATIRETTGKQWARISPTDMAYFGGRFTAASRKKSDVTPVFQAPSKPQTFAFCLPNSVWNNIQAREDYKVRNTIKFYYQSN